MEEENNSEVINEIIESSIPEPVIVEEEPTPEPVEEPTPEPVEEPEPEQVVEPTPEPVAEPEAVIVEEEPTPEPFVEPTPESVEEPTPEPVEEPTTEPVEEPTTEPVEEPTPEPVVEPTPEPVVEPTPEPVVESEPVIIKEEPVQEQNVQIFVEEIQPTEIKKNTIPKLVFIVPYRDREEQKKFFKNQMKNNILEDMDSSEYKIFFIHQNDKRNFNRGAIKNIGFIYVRNLYPNDYKNITFVFNDVDIMPLNKNFINYITNNGIIKHFYGFTHTLGGIVSITGSDFEKLNGFPNFWAWGYEDNLLQIRANENNIKVDRSKFYPIMDKNFILLHDGITRNVNKIEFDRYLKMTKEGINSINNLTYNIDVNDEEIININSFETGTTSFIEEHNKEHDLRNGPKPFGNTTSFIPRRGRRSTMGMIM